MKTFVLLTLLAGLSPIGAQETVTVKFEDIERFVTEKNTAVSGAKLMTEGAQARTGHMRRSAFPTVGTEFAAERFTTLQFPGRTEPYGHVEARVNLYRGGRDQAQESVLGNGVESASAQARRVWSAELASARATFWRLVSDRETVNLVQEAQKQNDKLLELANRRISRGLATETDRLEFEIHRSQLREEIESLTHAALLLEIRLAAELGLAAGTRFSTPESIEHEHDESLLSAAFSASEHPDARGLRAREKTLFAESRRQERWWAPSVDVYGGYYLYTLRERDSLARGGRDDKAIGMRLNLPLFDGLSGKAEAASLRLEREGVARTLSQTEAALAAEVAVAKEDLKHDHELIHYAEERLEQGKKYLARTMEEYERGVKNSPDALGAAQRNLAYRRQFAERRREYQITRAGLLALLGR